MSSPALNSCIYKSVTLAAGEQFNLPPGAVLVAATDATAITSTCPLPDELAGPICGTFFVVIDVDSNSGHPNDEENFRINNINVGGTIIDFGGQRIIASGSNPGSLVSLATLNSYIPLSLQNIFVFKNITRTVYDKHQDVTLVFQSLDVFKTQILMECQNFADVQYYKPKTITEGDC
jgi:hypothetical protein